MTIIYDNAWQTFKEQIITLSPLFVKCPNMHDCTMYNINIPDSGQRSHQIKHIGVLKTLSLLMEKGCVHCCFLTAFCEGA